MAHRPEAHPILAPVSRLRHAGGAAGWSPPARAPQLRRYADRLELMAADHEHPDRVRRLARDCRLRAARVELGEMADGDGSDLGEAADLVSLLVAARRRYALAAT